MPLQLRSDRSTMRLGNQSVLDRRLSIRHAGLVLRTCSLAEDDDVEGIIIHKLEEHFLSTVDAVNYHYIIYVQITAKGIFSA